jgi:hypothetical protein
MGEGIERARQLRRDVAKMDVSVSAEMSSTADRACDAKWFCVVYVALWTMSDTQEMQRPTLVALTS